jgi:hypothetical protein
MAFTHMNHIEPDHIMNFHNPNEPYGLPDILMSEDYKLMLARLDEYKEANPTQYKGRNPSAEDIDRECNEAEWNNRYYR